MSVFYPEQRPYIMAEVACEPQNTCSVDIKAYKALASQWIGATIQEAPFTNDTLSTRLRGSAVGAAKACPDGTDEAICGFQWAKDKSDADTGLGPQLGAVNVIVANLAAKGATSNDSISSSSSSSPGSTQTSSSSSTTSSQTSKPANGVSHFMPSSMAQGFCLGLAITFLLV